MGTIFVLIGGSLWGAMGIFVRGLAKCGLTSLEICFVRMFVSAILMGIYFLIFNRKALRIKLKDIWIFIGSGVFSLTFFGYCYFTTIQMTSMSVAAVLLYTSPVFVLVLSAILFKERITNIKILSILIAIVGCIFVTGLIGQGGQSLPVLGILLGLGSGLGYGLYSIFGRYAINRGYGAFTITFYSFLFSVATLLFIVNPVRIISAVLDDNIGSGTLINVSYAIGTALVVTILPYIFYTLGLTKIENSKAAVIACIEPIMATVLGFLIFSEKLRIYEIIGVLLVLSAIVLLSVSEKR